MDLLKGIIADSLNGFSPKFIPFFLLQLLIAGLLGHLMQKIVNRKFGSEIIQYAGLLAMAISLVVNSISFFQRLTNKGMAGVV